MEQEIIQKIALVISRLNAVTVSGKNNMTNLLGSIGVLEEVCQSIAGGAFTQNQKEE